MVTYHAIKQFPAAGDMTALGLEFDSQGQRIAVTLYWLKERRGPQGALLGGGHYIYRIATRSRHIWTGIVSTNDPIIIENAFPTRPEPHLTVLVSHAEGVRLTPSNINSGDFALTFITSRRAGPGA
jgi:hypothetical protein